MARVIQHIVPACLLLFLLVIPTVILAETPAGLVTLQPEAVRPSPERNWKRLGIADWELRMLERFHRGGGYEGFHIAYKSGDFNITGILTRPYIRDSETKYPTIILNHGSTRGVTKAYRAVALDLARRGYVVLASTFRGRSGQEGRAQGLKEFAKSEVIDALQLTQLARQLAYVDTLRLGIFGEGHGASVTIQAIERSNVFRAAVAISPILFSGMAEYGFAGMAELEKRSEELFGKQLSRARLVRELRERESFRRVRRIETPLLLITTRNDPHYRFQVRFVNELKRHDLEHRFLQYDGLFRGFMTAADNGERPKGWAEARDAAWSEVFAFLKEYLTGPRDARISNGSR